MAQHSIEAAKDQRSTQPLETADLLRHVCDALPFGLLVLSAQGEVCYYNLAYARLRFPDYDAPATAATTMR